MSDIENKHAEMVTCLVKSPTVIKETLTTLKCDLIHAAMGVSGEAGELLDAIKKHVIYDKPLDYTNVVEELGDLEFYMEQMRQALSIKREATLDANMKKLAERYKNYQYTDQQAQDRNDKKPI